MLDASLASFERDSMCSHDSPKSFVFVHQVTLYLLIKSETLIQDFKFRSRRYVFAFSSESLLHFRCLGEVMWYNINAHWSQWIKGNSSTLFYTNICYLIWFRIELNYTESWDPDTACVHPFVVMVTLNWLFISFLLLYEQKCQTPATQSQSSTFRKRERDRNTGGGVYTTDRWRSQHWAMLLMRLASRMAHC